MASLSDKITDVRNSERPNIARVTAGRSTGDNTLACDNLAGWPIDSKVHFVTYQIDSSNNPLAGTQLDCYGIVSGTEITSFTVVDGSDQGNQVNDVVEMLPTAQWGQDLADALTQEHNRDGTHSDITADSVTTDELIVSEPITGAGYSLATMHNPSKFSVYRAASMNVGSPTAPFIFDTKLYDTGNEYNTSTGFYTANQSGFLRVHARVGIASGNTHGNGLGISIQLNGADYKLGESWIINFDNWDTGVSVSGSIKVSAGDTVNITGYGSGLACKVGPTYTFFDGELISAT